MIRRISDSIDHAHGGVHKVVPIQVITPSEGSGQDEEQHGKMWNGSSRRLVCRPAVEPHKPEVHVFGNDGNNREAPSRR